MKPALIALLVLFNAAALAQTPQTQRFDDIPRPQSDIVYGDRLKGEDATARCAALGRADRAEIGGWPTVIERARIVSRSDSEQLPAFCQVQGYIAPQIGFELRIPIDTWNGKFLMQGCGGLCGFIKIASTDDALARGYAVTTTDMGHKGVPWSGIWAYNNPQAREDHAWRSTKANAEVARALVEEFFRQAPRHSYFRGCSTGGRQALLSAQRFPELFDGIIAGAPVTHQVGVGILSIGWNGMANIRADGSQIVGLEKLKVLQKAVMQRCDARDGLKDGIINDPPSCDFKPEQMQCKSAAKADCFTREEVVAINKIYDGARNARGEILFPGGLSRGSEYEWKNTLVVEPGRTAPIVNSSLMNDLLRYMAFDKQRGMDYGLRQFDFNDDALVAEMRRNEAMYSPTNPDLSAFRQAGGKLLIYHGWDDFEIPPAAIVDYYTRAVAANGGLEPLQEFARLFMIPGMAHCRRGPGPDAFDYLTALENWVEKGQAPDRLVGTKLKTPQPYDGLPVVRFPLPDHEVTAQRPVFPHPATVRYRGSGDPAKAESWVRTGGTAAMR